MKKDISLLEPKGRISKAKGRLRVLDVSGKRRMEMKAAAIDRFGPPNVLKLRAFPIPQPGAREVLIALYAAGVGVWDGMVRDGTWRPFGRPKFPLTLGVDGAGIVVGKGARVRRFQVGDRVWGYDHSNTKGGFYAEFVAVDEGHVGPVPERLDLLHAAAAAATGLTAVQGIDDQLRVRRGETVLIFGASGAVGTLAVQFARRRRARVLATASGRAAATLLRKLGAHSVVDARSKGAIDELRRLAPEGIDAVLALAGGKVLERCLDLVRPGGRVAYPHGVLPEPRRRANLRMRAYDAEAGPLQFARLKRAAEEARLNVPLAGVFTLAQAAKAHAQFEGEHVPGRMVLRMPRRKPPPVRSSL